MEAMNYVVKSQNKGRKVCLSEVLKENKEILSIIGRSWVMALGCPECF